jgi:hypothetical protein
MVEISHAGRLILYYDGLPFHPFANLILPSRTIS